MQSPRERYYSDPSFHILVDIMVAHIQGCKYTPSEMRDASILASIIYEEMNPHPNFPSRLFHDLNKWIDNTRR